MPRSDNHHQDAKQYKIRRSIVLGLGGTGRSVCTQLKKILLEQSDNDPARFSHVRLLSIDTDARVKKVQTERGDTVRLTKHELLGLRISPALDRQRFHRVMTDRQAELLSQANELGAMRCRPIGNAFLLANWAAIRSRVRDLIYDLARADLRAKVRTDPRYRGLDLDTNKLDIYVVGNLVSGTGSGMAVGLGYLLRDLTSELNDGNTEYQIEGVFTICGVYALDDCGGQPSPYAVNCYAALLELNHFTNRDIFMSNDEGYDPGFDQIRISEEARRQAPYQYVQLLNPSHSKAGELKAEELEPHIARVLALRIGSAVGMVAAAKIVDEMPNRSHYDDKGNLRFCWAWGANTFRSAGQELLDLATALAADQTLDVMTGEHIHAAINLKDEAWDIVRSVGLGYSKDTTQTSLLKNLYITQESYGDMQAGVSLMQQIEPIIRRAFPLPDVDNSDHIKGLPGFVDQRKGDVSTKLTNLISTVVSGNRRPLAQEIQNSIEEAILSLADYSEDGKGSLDDAIGIIELLIGSKTERGSLLQKDGESYQERLKHAISDRQQGRREVDFNVDSIRSIVSARGRFQRQALLGAWENLVKSLILQKQSEARQIGLEEARKILDGDGSDKNDLLRLGLIRHLQTLRIRLRSAREEIQRLDSRFEARVEALEKRLRKRGEDSQRLEKARDLKSQALEGEQSRIYARKVVEKVLGPPHSVASRYDDPDQLDRDYAKVDEIIRERVMEVGSSLLAASIENAPDFDGHLPTFLELSEPAIRLDPNQDTPPEVAYLSVPQNVPSFRAEVKRTGWLDAREISNKQDDELFQQRMDDAEPRVDVLVGRLTFSPASVLGIDRWATLYGRATVRPEGRRSVHTLPDSRGGETLVFEELGQTGTRVMVSYFIARSLLWLREEDGEVFYEHPRDTTFFMRDNERRRLGTSISDPGIIQEYKAALRPGVRDQELSSPVFLHAYRRFREAMNGGVDEQARNRLFNCLVIGVVQIFNGKGELGEDPHLPNPEQGDDLYALASSLRSTLQPLGLADDLFSLVREQDSESIPALGQVEALQAPQDKEPPLTAPPSPASGSSFQETLVSPEARQPVSGRTCPNGHPVADQARFCGECGGEIVDATSPNECANCDEPVEPSARFCSQCGHPVAAPLAEAV